MHIHNPVNEIRFVDIGRADLMGLADDFDALQSRHGGIRCAVSVALAEMSDDDRQVVIDALGNPRLQGTGIARVLRQHGFQVGDGAVHRHRRGECSCL